MSEQTLSQETARFSAAGIVSISSPSVIAPSQGWQGIVGDCLAVECTGAAGGGNIFGKHVSEASSVTFIDDTGLGMGNIEVEASCGLSALQMRSSEKRLK